MDPTMMDPEKLINEVNFHYILTIPIQIYFDQGNFELKGGNTLRALNFINHGLNAILDIDPVLFTSKSGNYLPK